MRTKILFYTSITLTIGILGYFVFDRVQTKQHNEFMPPPAFSVLNNITPMMSSTSSISAKKTLYKNETLGLSMELPTEISLTVEKAELQQYELGSGEDKLGQQYKYCEINFSDNSKRESGAYIIITAKETPYGTIDEWLEKDVTRGGNFPEDTVKFERKNMFGEDVFFGFDDWYKSYSTPEEKRSSEYVYIVKNSLLYKIELHNFSAEDREMIWGNIRLINI